MQAGMEIKRTLKEHRKEGNNKRKCKYVYKENNVL